LADALSPANVCARCAERSGTCCSLTPGDEEFCFPLSALERARMEANGAGPGHFVRQENTRGFVDNLCRLFPGEDAALRGQFPPDAAHDRLALAPAGECLLRGPEGCILPQEARPLYCRLFPFWVRGGRQMYFEFSQCQALLEGRGAAGLLRRLGMTEALVRELYRELRRAWGLPERA